MKITKLTALGLAMAAVAGQAFAEQASGTVDAKAGLQPALELSCTDVSFGVWRVPLRSAGGTTLITLDASANTVAASGNTTRVAQSTADVSWLHNRGTCTLSGSTAADETNANITFSGNTSMAFTGADATTTGYNGLAKPVSDATLTATLTGPATAAITSGATTFYIGGTLTIPQTIIANNYGGYKTSSSATVTADDGQ